MKDRAVPGAPVRQPSAPRWAVWLLGGLIGWLMGYGMAEYGRIRWCVARAGLRYHHIGICATFTGPGTGGPLRYLALGDSTAQGIGASKPQYSPPYLLAVGLTSHYSPVIFTNLAVSGATTRDVIRVQLPQMPAFAPDLVTVFVGINDLTHGRRRAAYLADLDRLLTTLDVVPAVVLTDVAALCCCPLLSPIDRALCRSVRHWFNAAVPTVVTRHRAHLAAISGALTPYFTQNPALWAADGYHASDAGYRLWAEGLLPLVLAALTARPQLPGNSPASYVSF